jgi:hypothetical protein
MARRLGQGELGDPCSLTSYVSSVRETACHLPNEDRDCDSCTNLSTSSNVMIDNTLMPIRYALAVARLCYLFSSFITCPGYCNLRCYCIRSRRHPMCRCCLLLVKIVSHVWVCGIEGGGHGEGMGPTACGKWSRVFNMGPKRSEVCTLQLRPPPQEKDFLHFGNPTCKYCTLYSIV